MSGLRWVTVALPGTFSDAHRDLFKNHLHPIVRAHHGSRARCVCDTFTESEYRFADLATARAAARAMNRVLRRLPQTGIIKPGATVMPASYERNGGRVIVRPDRSFDPAYRPKACRGFRL